ncbi:hypothetical protein U9608_001220 [Vibrio alginolyticus]|nr:hypothetical protein [Vibrio alginolyticus]
MTKEERLAKWCAEAKEHGLEHLERVDEHRSTYRFIECGHEQMIHRNCVRDDKFKCRQCIEGQWKREAELVGLLHLKYIGHRHSLYRFIACGHERSIERTAVRKGELRCVECKEEQWKREAESVGLTYLENVGSQCSKYICNNCESELVIERGDVRNASFNCSGCESSHWDKPCGTYLIKFKSNDFEWCKVGVAQDVNTRIRSFGLREDIEVSIQYFHMQSNRHIAQNHVERVCHEKFNECRLDFSLMQNYMQSGFTECFSIGVLGKLLTEIATNKEASNDNEFTLLRFAV